MANNSLKPGTKVKWYDPKRPSRKISGVVVGPSRQDDECVIVEWNDTSFSVSVEHLDDLQEIPD